MSVIRRRPLCLICRKAQVSPIVVGANQLCDDCKDSPKPRTRGYRAWRRTFRAATGFALRRGLRWDGWIVTALWKLQWWSYKRMVR